MFVIIYLLLTKLFHCLLTFHLKFFLQCALVNKYMSINLQSSRRDPLTEQQPEQSRPNPDNQSHGFSEYPYRWAIVGLMVLMMVINGLLNNLIIPIESTVRQAFQLTDQSVYAGLPVNISFLVYTISNFPANQIIDKKGLRFSFLLGATFYAIGSFLYCMIRKSYIYAVIAAVFVAVGQPFIINCPAKVATYWFLAENRPFATGLMTGALIIGTGIGFLIPSIAVPENLVNDEVKSRLFYLYAVYFLLSVLALLAVYFLMRKQPPTLPSIGAEQQKTNLKQSLKIIKKDKNLWRFFAGYMLIYGSVLSFGSITNLIMKPYNFTNVELSLFAIILLISGVLGAVCWTFYLKKTLNYQRTIRVIPTLSVIAMIIICIILNTNPLIALTFIFGSIVGFSVTPLMPISYDLGCQLCFPMGEAQVTGLLNGGAMILTFFLSLLMESAIKLQNKSQSLIAFIIYIILVFCGAVAFYFVKIDLKRRNAEKEGHTMNLPEQSQVNQNTENQSTTAQKQQNEQEGGKNVQIEMTETTKPQMMDHENQEVFI